MVPQVGPKCVSVGGCIFKFPKRLIKRKQIRIGEQTKRKRPHYRGWHWYSQHIAMHTEWLTAKNKNELIIYKRNK